MALQQLLVLYEIVIISTGLVALPVRVRDLEYPSYYGRSLGHFIWVEIMLIEGL